MSCRSRWLPAAAVIGCLLAALPGQAIGSLDDGDMQELVDELRPVVEKVCGRKFKKPPVAYTADSGDMMRVFRVELEAQLADIYKGQSASRIQRALQLRADILGAGAIGKYEFATGEVLVIPRRVSQNMSALGVDESEELAVLKLFVAHELVHALQDQEMGLAARYGKMTQADVIDSLVMRTEGHAVMCSEMVMRELDLLPAIDTGRAVLRGTKKSLKLSGSLISNRQTRCRTALLYLSGADLLYEEFEAGGMAQVWKVLQSDRQLTELLRPRAKLPPIVSRRACFDGLGDRLGGRGWCVGTAALAEINLISENYAERDAAIAALSDCVAGGDWHGNSGTPFAWRKASALRFRTVAAATKYRELAERCAVRDLKLATNKKQTAAEAGPTLKGGESRVLSQDQPGNAKAQIHWFQRGECLVQITLVRAPLADEVLVSVANEVLAALAK